MQSMPATGPSSKDDAEHLLYFDNGVELRLTTEGLQVTDASLRKSKRYDCCGLNLPRPGQSGSHNTDPTTKGTPSTHPDSQSIPYHYVLWADVVSSPTFKISITYADHLNKTTVSPKTLHYDLDNGPCDTRTTQKFVEALLDRAYKTPAGISQQQKRIKVLINPFGGTGKAQSTYTKHIAPIFTAARCFFDVQATTHVSHAKEIARDIDVDKWDVIACCSGDGVPHEVFNGLALQERPRRALRKVAVVQLPCGSGNAMSLNLTGTIAPSLAALAVVKGIRTKMDLICITQGEERYLSFLSQSLGIVAESDLATEHLRWLGNFRFDLGFAMRAFGKKIWPIDIAYVAASEDKTEIKAMRKKYLKTKSMKSVSSKGENGTNYTTMEAEEEEDHGDETSPLPPLKYGTVNDPLTAIFTTHKMPNLGNLYAGNMPYMTTEMNFFQAALPSDGYIDLVTIRGDVSGFKAISIADKIRKRTLFFDDEVLYRKVEVYRVTPRQDTGYVSVDGESVPFTPWQAECFRGLGTVLSRRGGYEAEDL